MRFTKTRDPCHDQSRVFPSYMVQTHPCDCTIEEGSLFRFLKKNVFPSSVPGVNLSFVETHLDPKRKLHFDVVNDVIERSLWSRCKGELLFEEGGFLIIVRSTHLQDLFLKPLSVVDVTNLLDNNLPFLISQSVEDD